MRGRCDQGYWYESRERGLGGWKRRVREAVMCRARFLSAIRDVRRGGGGKGG